MRRLLFPLLLGLFGVAVLGSLCVWQVQRLQWKKGVLLEIDQRIGAPPLPLPRAATAEWDNFQPVRVKGRLSAPHLYVLVSRQGFGPGFRVISPFETDGRRVLLDQGFLAETETLEQSITGDRFEITGNLHWPDETDRLFTPEPDGALWFARDVEAMADTLGTEPLLIVLRHSEPIIGQLRPWPVDSAGIPNNHRNYAITWFLLALAWCGMTALWVWRIRRGREG